MGAVFAWRDEWLAKKPVKTGSEPSREEKILELLTLRGAIQEHYVTLKPGVVKRSRKTLNGAIYDGFIITACVTLTPRGGLVYGIVFTHPKLPTQGHVLLPDWGDVIPAGESELERWLTVPDSRVPAWLFNRVTDWMTKRNLIWSAT